MFFGMRKKYQNERKYSILYGVQSRYNKISTFIEKLREEGGIVNEEENLAGKIGVFFAGGITFAMAAGGGGSASGDDKP